MKKSLVIINVFLMLFFTNCSKNNLGEPITGKKWNIDLIKYLDNSYTQTFESNLYEAFRENGFKEGRDYEIRSRSAQSDISNLTLLVNAAVTDKVDLLITFQAQSLYAAINRAPNIPKIFTLLQNPFIMGAGQSDSNHIPNLTGFYIIPPVDLLLDAALKCEPKIKKAGTLFMIGDDDSVLRKEELIKAAASRNIEIAAEGYSSQLEISNAAASLIAKDVDSMIHLMDPSQDVTFPAMFDIAKRQKKPVLSVVHNMQKIGASIVYSTDRNEMGKKFAEMVIRIMKGENPSNMPFENDIALPKKIGVNVTAAKDANYFIPDSLYK
ncbi:MAG TPA: ABC transporter substrate-binding protein [bacterium]|nr:ABC transporter substrate-binding protein [bacterium]HPN29377.1 ABC transporter substrate-binding protein [bacterium]